MLSLALIIHVAAAAAATAPAERIARGNAALEDLEFEAAVDLLMSVVVDPAATDEERFEANVLAGTAHRILGHDDEARLCFRYVLLKRPDFRLNPSKSPKVVQFFDLVRQELEAERAATQAPKATQVSPGNATPERQPSLLPILVVAGGITALVAGGSLVAFAELNLAEPQTARDQEGLLTTGRVAAVVAAAGALTMAGGVLWSLE